MQSGNLRMLVGDNEGAVTVLRAVVEQQPEHAVAWRRLGLALFLSGRYAASAEAYERSLELGDRDPEAQIERAAALIGAGREEEGSLLLSRFSHPTSFRATQEIREEASRLTGETDPAQIRRRLKQALERADRQERIDRR